MDVLQAIYDSEIHFEITAHWDLGFWWKLGHSACGYDAQGRADSLANAVDALAAAVREHYPDSAFARQAR